MSRAPQAGRPRKTRDIGTVVREACFWLPEVEEKPSARLARLSRARQTVRQLRHQPPRWTAASRCGCAHPRARSSCTACAIHSVYFVPPYVGPKGWLGVELNKALTWERIAQHIRDAYLEVAPASLAAKVGDPPKIKPPSKLPKPEDIDPFLSSRGQRLLQQMDERALGYPETSRGTQFGSPTWVAGKKTFASAYEHEGRFTPVLLGRCRSARTRSPPTPSTAYRVTPAATAGSPWMRAARINWNEVDDLLEHSYRHFALKRMLKALDGG